MRIQRLEIQGFKSFAERTVLHFGDGITGIVGPNGCGKSNVVDALRWAMGEQSAKHLRGNGMEDVIFAGSESRGPLGMAEVTITFKNDDGTLVPEELRSLSEISVTRRLFRDGTSEYLMNRRAARLRDVVDLFLGTGVGTKSYSIIEQGRVGLVVTAKPEDRRSLIEDAAGITKYKTRRKQAERRLEAAEQNLLRVTDVTSELAKRMATLERQAKKATRFKELREELRQLEFRAAAERHVELSRSIDEETQRRDVALVGRAEIEAALAREEPRVAEELRALDHRARELESRRLRLFEVEQTLAVGSKNVEHLGRELTGVLERRAEAERERERLQAERAHAEVEQETARAEALALGHTSADAHRAVEDEARTLAELGQRIQVSAQELERRKRTLVECLTLAAQQDQALGAELHRAHDLEHRARTREVEAQRVGDEAAALLHRTDDTRRELDARRRQKQETDALRVAGEAQLEALEARFLQEEAIRIEVRGTLLDRRSRLTMLEEIQRNYEGYQDGVRAVMRRREDAPAFEGRIHGLVAEILTPPPDLERAVEAVLGDRLQSVIVESLDTGKLLVESLRSTGDGRSTFVPRDPREDHAHWAPPQATKHRSTRPSVVMTVATRARADGQVETLATPQPLSISLRPLPAPEPVDSNLPRSSISDRPIPAELRAFVDELERELRQRGRQDIEISSIPEPAELVDDEAWPDLRGPGVHGKLADLVRVERGFEPVARVLLGDVVVVDALETAQSLWLANGHRKTFVTLAGEVLDPVGVLSGGSHQGVSQGLLAKKREILELRGAVTELEARVAGLDAALAGLKDEIDRAEAELASLAARAHAEDLDLVRLESDVSALLGARGKTEERHALVLKEHAALVEEHGRSRARVEQLQAGIAGLAERRQGLEAEVQAQATELETARTAESAQREALLARRVSLAERRERKESLERALERATVRLAELDARLSRLGANLETATDMAEHLERQMQDATRERTELEAEATVLREEVAALDERFVGDRDRLRAEDEALRRARQEADAFRSTEAAAELAARGHGLAREALEQQLRERYQVELVEILPEFSGLTALAPDELEHRDDLRRKIGAMGDINLTAITEFEEVRERHAFMNGQREDLARAIQMLRGAIRKINLTSEQRFVDTFNLVNKKFQDVFPRLFHGGEAKLILSNESDPLEAGIEMLVQPPGKKLQSASLLSGGEKALTAVALIFSIFLIKPTPFCLLDEVDAPLDDANVGRYNELIRDISSVSQIIVITHNKRTMEVPDRLYGITMEEPGISRLVGVDIRATEQHLRLVS